MKIYTIKSVMPFKSTFRLMSLVIATLFMQSCDLIDNEDDAEPEETEWSYEDTDWTKLGYSECGGKVESPINIETNSTVKAQLAPLVFDYAAVPATIVNTGHTIQANVKRKNFFSVNGAKFQLMQFHFHHLSEHKVNGTAYDMELHLVNQDSVTGNLAVVGVFLKQGAANAELAKFFNNLPATKNQEMVVNDNINLLNLMPANKKYYTYTGSLTTPPCTQGVNWVILKTPIEISADQISAFAKLYANDARPVQPLNNRRVLESL